MSMIDWIIKRSIRQMAQTYFVARSKRLTHEEALKAVVWSRFPDSPPRATAFWDNHLRRRAERPLIVSSDENQEEVELKSLIQVLLAVISGGQPPGVDYFRLIENIFKEF
jgi:hypothetical protein